MTHDMAETIYDQIVYYESLGLKQLQVVLIGGNTVREEKNPHKLLGLIKNFLKQIVDVQGLHLVFGTLIPSPGTDSEDDENFKIFDFGLKALISTFPQEKFSCLNLTRAF